MNLGLFRLLDRFKDLGHAWERSYLGNRDIVFRNSFAQIESVPTPCAGSGTRFECECYDTAHL